MSQRLIFPRTVEANVPEFVFLDDGRQVRIRDVVLTLSTKELEGAYYFLEDGRSRAWPWKGAGYYVDDETGKAVVPMGPDVPRMSRDALEELGMSDEKLEAERVRLFGAPVGGHTDALSSDKPDSLALMAARKAIYDRCAAEWYKPDADKEAKPATRTLRVGKRGK